jgi:Lrp/AsnC family transcriptional regulator for asnA, asnC and gidA
LYDDDEPSASMELDDTDRHILRILQENARTPFSEVARRIDMSSATVHDRVNRMQEAGVIEGYHAKVDPREVGFGISAIVGLRVEQGREQDTLDKLEAIEGVQEIHLTTGEWDVMARVYAEDADALRELMFEEVAQMDGFARSQTMVVLGTEHESDELPV